MLREIKTKIGLALLVLMSAGAPSVSQGAILFDGADTGGVTVDDTIVIDYDASSAGNRELQFGSSSIYLRYDGSKFQLSNDLDLNSNQIRAARLENVAEFPESNGNLGLAGTGRIVQLTAPNALAPGCTGGPVCQPGTYTWNGGIWVPLTGTITTATATKIVTVGPVGRDYTTIAEAAAYLNTLSGGEMWIDPGVYPIVNSPDPVDLTNIRLVGTDSTTTTISISGGNTALVDGTDFADMIIDVSPTLVSTYAFNLQYTAGVSSSLEFDHADIKVGLNKYLIDSSASTAPLGVFTFKDSTQSGTDGFIVRGQGIANLNTASAFTVINQLGKTPLKITDWPVKIIGGGNVVTDGTINAVPDRTIMVSPGMSIQGAIDSLGAQGGVVKLLIGTHIVREPLIISNNNIQLTGEGPGTTIRADNTWLNASPTIDDAVIQIGLSDGSSPRSNVVINSFRLEVFPNLHGIQVNGGSDIKVMDMTVSSIGPKSSGRTGIVFTDGLSTPSARFTLTRSSVTNDNNIANMWVDGVHMDGDDSYAGLLGYGNGISDSIISEVIVNQAHETSFAFAGVTASGIFSNRARDLGYTLPLETANPLALFLTNSTDVLVMNNTVEGNANTVTSTYGIWLQANVDDSIFLGNTLRGGANAFAVAISIQSPTSERNIFSENIIQNATQEIVDNGSNSKMETNHIRSTVNPTFDDDLDLGYTVGTIWLNTTSERVYVMMSDDNGAAVWTDMTPVPSHTQNTDLGSTSNNFILDYDSTGGNVALQFGNTLNERLTWNSAFNRFEVTDDLYVGGQLGVLEGGPGPTYYTIFQGSDQGGNLFYTLPGSQGAANTMLQNDGTGILSWRGTVGMWMTFLSDATYLTWTNMPAAITELTGARRRLLVDLTNASQARLSVQVNLAGAAGSALAIQYSLDQSTWNYLDASNGPFVPTNVTGLIGSSFVTITPAARTNVYLRVIGRSGNGTSDPRFTSIQLEIK